MKKVFYQCDECFEKKKKAYIFSGTTENVYICEDCLKMALKEIQNGEM